MADDVTLPATSGTVGADEISSVKYQRVKLIHGVDGTNDGDVAATNGFPVKASNVTATLQNAVSATGNGSNLSVLGMATAVLTVSGTFTATVTFEGSEDATNFVAIPAYAPATGLLSTTATAAGVFVVPCAGMQSIRGRVTWTSGTSVTVTGHAIAQPWDTISKNVAQIGGTAVDTNSGNKSAGTQRVVIATDQPGLTTAWNNQGDVAHGSANSGNPMQIGVEAIAHGTNPTQTAAGNRTKLYANRHGIPFVMGGHPNIITNMQVITTAVTDSSTITGTIATGTKVVVTQIQFTVDNASTVFPKIIIGFGATNTPASGVGVLAAHPGVPAGGGFTRGDGSGILGVGADGEEMRVTTVGTIGGNGGYLTVSYYTIES